MTSKKPRKSLDDALATEFVYGRPSEPLAPVSEPPVATVPAPAPAPEPDLEPEAVSVPPSQAPSAPKGKRASRPTASNNFMTNLIQSVPQKEATVRLTVDLTETQHRRLSILCAQTGRKKAEIVRLLLNEALDGVDE